MNAAPSRTQQVPREGCVTGVARLPDGRLLLALVSAAEPFVVTTEEDLFGS